MSLVPDKDVCRQVDGLIRREDKSETDFRRLLMICYLVDRLSLANTLTTITGCDWIVGHGRVYRSIEPSAWPGDRDAGIGKLSASDIEIIETRGKRCRALSTDVIWRLVLQFPEFAGKVAGDQITVLDMLRGLGLETLIGEYEADRVEEIELRRLFHSGEPAESSECAGNA